MNENKVEVMELIENLYTMVSEAWGVPLGNDKCIVEREAVLEILNEIKTRLPVEPKTGISEASPLTAASITEMEKKNVATVSSMLTTILVITPTSAPLPTDFALLGRLSS